MSRRSKKVQLEEERNIFFLKSLIQNNAWEPLEVENYNWNNTNEWGIEEKVVESGGWGG